MNPFRSSLPYHWLGYRGMEPLQCTAGVNLAQPLHCVRFLFHEKSGKCCFQRWDCHGAILHPTSEPTSYSFHRSFHAQCHQWHQTLHCWLHHSKLVSFWKLDGERIRARNGRGKGGVIFAKTFRPISESDSAASGMKSCHSSSYCIALIRRISNLSKTEAEKSEIALSLSLSLSL